MKPLTEKQRRVLNFIKSEIKSKQRPPSIREIGSRFGVASPNDVHRTLRQLVCKGKIAIEPNAKRAITVLDKPPRGIPLLTLKMLSRT